MFSNLYRDIYTVIVYSLSQSQATVGLKVGLVHLLGFIVYSSIYTVAVSIATDSVS